MSTHEPSQPGTPEPDSPSVAAGSRNKLTTIVAVLGVLAVLVISVVAYQVLTKQDDDTSLAQAAASAASDNGQGGSSATSAAPASSAAASGNQPGPLVNGGFQVGQDNAPAAIEIYSDYGCSACRAYEAQHNGQLQQWVKDGKARVIYKPVAILDGHFDPESMYSSRSANAAAAVFSHAGARAFQAYHVQLLAKQPSPGTAGLSDAQLLQLAREAQVSQQAMPAVEKAITTKQYAAWVQSSTKQFIDLRVKDAAGNSPEGPGTPTVLVNGVWVGPGQDLAEAVDKAANT